ncbi:MAG: hypothetical protein WAM30_13120, partial [Candidatus Dormiibacterota bacterium]
MSDRSPEPPAPEPERNAAGRRRRASRLPRVSAPDQGTQGPFASEADQTIRVSRPVRMPAVPDAPPPWPSPATGQR